MFINTKQVKKYLHENQKQISKEALESLNVKVEKILMSAIDITGRFKRITATEITLAKGG